MNALYILAIGLSSKFLFQELSDYRKKSIDTAWLIPFLSLAVILAVYPGMVAAYSLTDEQVKQVGDAPMFLSGASIAISVASQLVPVFEKSWAILISYLILVGGALTLFIVL